MPKRKKKNKKEQSESKALWRMTTLFIVFGAVIFGLFWWARTDAQSESAKKFRELLGIVLIDAPEPEPEPIAPVYQPEPEPAPEPEPKPEPVIAVEPPEPKALSWSHFRSQSQMWPTTLEIAVDKEVSLTYRGKVYGEVAFSSGQILNVIEFSQNGFVHGRINGNEMEVHVSATNFSAWFEETHSEDYEMTIPDKEIIKPAKDYEQELITNLRIWSMQNYNTPLIEINQDNLVLRLKPRRSEANPDYSPEAHSIARTYLRIQAELGGTDTYVSCEILDSKTGAVIGSKGIFIPRF